MPEGSKKEDEWMSLREASRRIGVSAATLRSWADRGRVHTFRTPGGHRRFRESDLAALGATEPAGSESRTLGLLAHAALGRTRFEVADGWLAKEDWYLHFPAGAREQHRELGRKVVVALSELMSGGISAEKANSRAAELGRAYRELNRQYDIGMNDALRAFLFFRDSFIESLTELAKSSPGLDVLNLLRQASSFVDAILLAMMESGVAPKPVKKKAF